MAAEYDVIVIGAGSGGEASSAIPSFPSLGEVWLKLIENYDAQGRIS